MIVKAVYKTLRSIIFSLTLLVVGIYVATYTLVSIPAFTNKVKDRACQELSNIIGSKVEIENLDIYPFNEIRISGLKVFDLENRPCISVETLAAGISLWKLVWDRKFVLTYTEIISLDAKIVQPDKDAPVNIDFIIKAFSPKDKNREKKHFELALKNVVLRKSSLSFSRPWLNDAFIGDLNLSLLDITDIAADISFPKISDTDIQVDLRRLSLAVQNAISIEKIGLTGNFSAEGFELNNFTLQFPSSRIFIPHFNIFPKNGESLAEAFHEEIIALTVDESYVTPSDFAFLFPALNHFPEKFPLSLQVDGNLEEIVVHSFELGSPDFLSISFSGGAESLSDINKATGDVSDFNLSASSAFFKRLPEAFPALQPLGRHAISNLAFLNVKADFAASMANKSFKGNLSLISDLFSITFEGGLENFSKNQLSGEGELNLENVKVQSIFPSVPIGNINANIVAEGKIINKNPEGMVSLVIEDIEYKGKSFEGLSFNISKTGENLEGDLWMSNQIAEIESKFNGDIDGDFKTARLDLDLRRLDLAQIIDLKEYNGFIIDASLNVDAATHGFNDLQGFISFNNCSFSSPDNVRSLKLKQLEISAEVSDSVNIIDLKSDWVNARAEGIYKIKELPQQIKNLASSVFPALVTSETGSHNTFASNLDLDIVVKKNNSIPEFFNLPIRLLVPISVSGSLQGTENSASLSIDIPYLQQGRDKLIYDTKLVADLNGNSGSLDALIQTTLPVKRGDLALNLNFFGHNDNLSSEIHFVNTENPDFAGLLTLETDFKRNQLSQLPEILISILPSELKLGTADWNISKTLIAYSGNQVTIDGLRLWHDDQFVEVQGSASSDFADVMRISLADIDVDYIFDMLQINYVTFGGTATGEIIGHSLLSGDPVAETESLLIKDFTYNGASLGECVASSRWNNEEKEIEITADITQNGRKIVAGSGGIWLGRDSLCFNIGADKVPVEFIQPFMAVFSSHVGGFATGDVKLFGTFRDIDMTGKIFADSVAVKLDYTNTVYHGSDSIFLNPGRIEIPGFRLYDKFGNSALLTGELTHRFFHDPAFNFRLSEADNFLCYDTNSDLNPDWYGTLFGSGSANLTGVPGLTDISADMTVSGNSIFTFVLSDTQYAQDYQFLSFSDKKKEELLLKQKNEITPRDMKEMLRKHLSQEALVPSKFGIDIRATVTPQVLFTLVMDPAAGDKITARGRGAMQVKYESDNDEMTMYGKYEIDEGNYNFSLQDIILRDFKIKEGSYITFNGNPLAADLDISATYRVNTNLSDLDKSFSTDRDLNRTNVPVDAVLSVTGNMTSPDITFDIELPTLTQDVERKVKSIISTDDMMNRQIIYLLALNRFYTPEYMGASGNGGELAAVASSTISSQLSNILGQLTDKFSVSPSFRSDKGDFSDIEVDVALSSRLLNNRLLINGNFGYRDRSNSSTTFVGDFDVEYLLSKNGNIRLKAYNHFNDQNYYLREALTTQGLGIVYRKDFDDWFTFLKKRKSKEISSP